MLAFENSFSAKFIWQEAKMRKSKGCSSMDLNSYPIFKIVTKLLYNSHKDKPIPIDLSL